MIEAAKDTGLAYAQEVFADRAYEEDGTLVNRRKPGAMITDEDEAIRRVIGMVKDGKVTFNTDKEQIRRLWDNYYVPYMKGYFASMGKFRSDDVKTGDILAYTGSTASAMYFPDNIEGDDSSYPVDFIVCDVPIMEGGENYKVQQGADMAVTKSDEKHEYASCVFLKWLTQKEQNLSVCM